MGEKEIREKYGGKLDKAVNRAVRAETKGGNEALDLLAKLSGPAASSGWTDDGGALTHAAAAYIKHRDTVVAKLIEEVRQRWDLPRAKPQGFTKLKHANNPPKSSAPRKGGAPKRSTSRPASRPKR